AGASCTYWMNRLQSLKTETDLMVTLNATGEIDPESILYRTDYRHPILDIASMTAQKHLWQLQGNRNTWFCGSYFGYGFHEDALQSGLAVAEQAGGVRRPWSVENESARIHIEPVWAMEAGE
ncbi:MAG: NAD/FAD-binding protein, partial [Nitratireductor sp.]|nr:NAD/FAD-binding protein [Nitratireductor sp.]